MSFNNVRQRVLVLNDENSIKLNPFEQCQVERLKMNWPYYFFPKIPDLNWLKSCQEEFDLNNLKEF